MFKCCNCKRTTKEYETQFTIIKERSYITEEGESAKQIYEKKDVCVNCCRVDTLERFK